MMKKLIISCFISVATVLSIPIFAQSLPSAVTQALQKADIPVGAVGVYVQEVSPPARAAKPTEILINWQADRALQPGSTMKLVTSYAALDLLGPAYAWKTSVFTRGHIGGDVLKGDLIIRGGGDPQLVVENFWMLIRQIRSKGIREIQGNLIIDTSWMEPQQFDAADFDGAPTRPYNVGPYALLVNYNALDLQLHPDTKGLQVTNLTPLDLQTKINVQFKPGECGDWRYEMTPTFSMVRQKMNMELTGTYAVDCGDKVLSVNPYPLSHADYVGALFRQLWKETGGEFRGDVLQAALPADAKLLTDMDSKSLSEVLWGVNKYSNNVMSRLVMLTLDSAINQQAANSDRAAQIVKNWLPSIGVDPKGFEIENGSGLSRKARISAQQMGRLLNHVFASRVMPEFMSSMSVLGVDGLAKKHGSKHAVVGHAHVKGGRLNEVLAVAGFVLAESGKRYVVVCMVNHANADKSRSVQDELLQWVYANG